MPEELGLPETGLTFANLVRCKVRSELQPSLSRD